MGDYGGNYGNEKGAHECCVASTNDTNDGSEY